MKNYCFLLLAFLFSFLAKAQNNDVLFVAQMQGILIDVPNNFEHFKGLLIEEKDSTAIYTSKMTLPGTTKNEISTNSKGSYYKAVIATSLEENAALELGKTWKAKLISAIDKGYEEMPFDANENNMVRKGFMFIHDQYSANIHWVKKGDEQTYTIYLVLMHLN